MARYGVAVIDMTKLLSGEINFSATIKLDGKILISNLCDCS